MPLTILGIFRWCIRVNIFGNRLAKARDKKGMEISVAHVPLSVEHDVFAGFL